MRRPCGEVRGALQPVGHVLHIRPERVGQQPVIERLYGGTLFCDRLRLGPNGLRLGRGTAALVAAPGRGAVALPRQFLRRRGEVASVVQERIHGKPVMRTALLALRWTGEGAGTAAEDAEQLQ